MSEDRATPKKTLKDRIQDAVEGLLDSLTDLITPPRELIPVRPPVRVRRPPRRHPGLL